MTFVPMHDQGAVDHMIDHAYVYPTDDHDGVDRRDDQIAIQYLGDELGAVIQNVDHIAFRFNGCSH